MTRSELSRPVCTLGELTEKLFCSCGGGGGGDGEEEERRPGLVDRSEFSDASEESAPSPLTLLVPSVPAAGLF